MHLTQIMTGDVLRREYFPHLTERGFECALSRSPWQFPPHFTQPGNSRKLWLRVAVDAWLLSIQPQEVKQLLQAYPPVLGGLLIPEAAKTLLEDSGPVQAIPADPVEKRRPGRPRKVVSVGSAAVGV